MKILYHIPPLRFRSLEDARAYQITGDLKLCIPSHIPDGNLKAMVPNPEHALAPFEIRYIQDYDPEINELKEVALTFALDHDRLR